MDHSTKDGSKKLKHTVLVFLARLSWEDTRPTTVSTSSHRFVAKVPFALLFSLPGAKLSLEATGCAIPGQMTYQLYSRTRDGQLLWSIISGRLIVMTCLNPACGSAARLICFWQSLPTLVRLSFICIGSHSHSCQIWSNGVEDGACRQLPQIAPWLSREHMFVASADVESCKISMMENVYRLNHTI